MGTETQQKFCEKCRKMMKIDQFYSTYNTEKYPDGHLSYCKKCVSMHVNNFEPDTYLWILQECDVPYVPGEWNQLLKSYGKDPTKLTGLTILGRYLAKMRLRQHKDFRWKDSAFLQEVAEKQLAEALQARGATQEMIVKEKEKLHYNFSDEEIEVPDLDSIPDEPVYYGPEPKTAFEMPSPVMDPEAGFNPAQTQKDILEDMDLNEEETTYLLLKWGKTYKPSEWIQLEQLYEQMIRSYDIQTAGDINTLKLACKASLKSNQLMDIGD